MIELKIPRDLVAAGMVFRRLFERVIQYVNAAKNALVKRFTILYRSIWVALSSIRATSSRSAKRAITKSVTALFRK